MIYESISSFLLNKQNKRGIDALSNVDFSAGTGIYSNFSLCMGKTAGYNNKILLSSTDLKAGWNKNISKSKGKVRSPLTKSETHSVKNPDDKSIKDSLAAMQEDTKTILPINNQNMLAGKHSYEKLAITLLVNRNWDNSLPFLIK